MKRKNEHDLFLQGEPFLFYSLECSITLFLTIIKHSVKGNIRLKVAFVIVRK